MKKLKRLSFIALLGVAVALSFNSCKKAEKGDTGPKGDTGATGPQGPTGATGNANIISIPSFYISNWYELSNDGTNYQYTYDKYIPELTQDIVNNGVVMAYNSIGSGIWLAMPLTNSFNGASISYGYAIYTGGIQFNIQGYCPSCSPNASDFVGEEFRIVIIPPAMKKKDLDYSNYNAVVATYGLKE